MATTKTIQPTGATITIPDFTDQPDVRPVATDLSNITDAANAINTQIEPVVGTGKAWIVNAELNNYTTTGTYYIGTGATVGGTSLGMQYGMLVVNSGRTDTVEHTFIVNGGKRYYRELRNSSWSAFYSLDDQIVTLVKQTTQSLTTDSSGMVDINTSKKPIVGVQVVKSSDSSACRAIQIRCRDYQGKLEYKYLIQEWGNGNPVLSTGITVYVTYIDINLT